jgi:phytoene synthase
MNDREVIRRHSKSFALAARVLPRAARERAEALYAWCRAADDRIDLAADRAGAARALADLRAEVDDAFAGRPAVTPAADALRRAVTACGIPREYPLELLAGFEMDVRGVRYETADQLLRYCHRVAGVVGLMMCHALGVTDEAALPRAAHLGTAMQLTNIARDVAEDWTRGRLYLPAEWLARVPDPGEPLSDELLAPAVRRCLELADRHYRSAAAGVTYLSPRCGLAIRTAARAYRAIGDEIAARGYSVARGRAVVSGRRKLGILVRSALAALPDLLFRAGHVRTPGAVQTLCPLPDEIVPTHRRLPMTLQTRAWREAASTALFALATTAAAAAVLFATVGVNPKEESYGNAPWYYAGVCAAASALLTVAYRWLDRSVRIAGSPE